MRIKTETLLIIVTDILLAAISFYIGLIAGEAQATRSIRIEAVKHAAAHWDTDISGSVKFHWNFPEIPIDGKYLIIPMPSDKPELNFRGPKLLPMPPIAAE
jgi:hypothetical protein